ncbi:unnamed protein product [Allacma fusca]|uniref:Uncharacterized protein n=1 Tax=Allacma fusca TaxID=39272 RepID=A0A8J2L1Q1_9HEXA|nr:unnamed protein product [Allacma fusca]
MSSMTSKFPQQKSIFSDPDEDILEKEVMESHVTPKLKRRKDDILELIRVKEFAAQKPREEELCIKREKLEILELEKNSEMEERNRKLALEERRLTLEEKKLEFEMKYRDKNPTSFFQSV